MAKKTRTIIAFDEQMEKKVYDYCDMLGIKDRNIATRVFNQGYLIDIYCSSKKFDQLAFKTGLSKVNAWW